MLINGLLYSVLSNLIVSNSYTIEKHRSCHFIPGLEAQFSPE